MGDVFRMHSFNCDTTTSLGYEGFTYFNTGTSNIVRTIETGVGPFGENALKCVYSGGSGDAWMTFGVPAGNRYFSMGFWFKMTTVALNTNIIQMINAAGTAYSLRTDVATPGKVVCSFGANTTPLGTTTILSDTWAHFQVSIFGNATTGFMKVRINGSDDTQILNINTAASDISSIRFRNGFLANLWAAASNSADAGFKGMCLVRPLKPTSDSAVNLTPQSGTDNFAMVDETTINEADYNFADTTTFPITDLYGVETMVDTPEQMIAFAVKAFGKRTNTDPVVMRGYVKHDVDAAVESTDSLSLGTTTTGKQFVWNTHPDGTSGAISGLTGTAAKDMINDSVFGVHLDSTV